MSLCLRGPAGQDPEPPLAGQRDTSTPQRGLADPGLALEEQGAWSRSMLLEEARDRGELLFSPEDRVLDHAVGPPSNEPPGRVHRKGPHSTPEAEYQDGPRRQHPADILARLRHGGRTRDLVLLTACSRRNDTHGHGTTTDDTGRHVREDLVPSRTSLRIRCPKGRGSSTLPNAAADRRLAHPRLLSVRVALRGSADPHLLEEGPSWD
jgi:hypothetical protein